MVVTGTAHTPNEAHLALLGSCWTASPGGDPVPSAEDSLWREDESRAALSYRRAIDLRAAARLLPATLRDAAPAAFVGHQPSSVGTASGGSSSPSSSAAIAEGFVHLPKERRFFFFFFPLHVCLAVQFGFLSIRRLPIFFHV